MSGMMYLAVGMPRSGSGWHYNLIHDLVVASGGQDAHKIRRKFRLQSILTEVNCNIGAFTSKRLVPVLIPALLGKRYVIKAHAGPTALLMWLIQKGKISPFYIYRDPRDALLSAYEYGLRKRAKGAGGAFTELWSVDDAIEFIRKYVAISETWLACEKALHTRYEDMLMNYTVETQRILDFLGLDHQNRRYQVVIDRYRPEKGDSKRRGTHFVQGKTGRFRQALTEEQQQRCLELFGPYLERMGFPLS